MTTEKTVFMAAPVASPLVYIGAVTNMSRSVRDINAKRDPNDPVNVLWSASGNSGFDTKILKAFSRRRHGKGRWFDLGNTNAVIAALDNFMARTGDLEVHESAKEQAMRFHVAACGAAYDAVISAEKALRMAPWVPLPVPAIKPTGDLDTARAAIVDLIKVRVVDEEPSELIVQLCGTMTLAG